MVLINPSSSSSLSIISGLESASNNIDLSGQVNKKEIEDAFIMSFSTVVLGLNFFKLNSFKLVLYDSSSIVKEISSFWLLLVLIEYSHFEDSKFKISSVGERIVNINESICISLSLVDILLILILGFFSNIKFFRLFACPNEINSLLL